MDDRSFTIRLARADDAAIIAHHRVQMFRDMGTVSEAMDAPLRSASIAAIERLIASGDYVGWLASPADEPRRVIAGVGIHRRMRLPFPTERAVAEGREAIVVNVFTEPEFRRRGIARALMHTLMAWSRDNALERLVLHAARDGRPLYEKLGFVDTNEMRFAGDLATWSPANRESR